MYNGDIYENAFSFFRSSQTLSSIVQIYINTSAFGKNMHMMSNGGEIVNVDLKPFPKDSKIFS